MPKIIPVDFNNDIIEAALKNEVLENTTLIFNSHSEISRAYFFIQNKYGFVENKLQLISEWEDSILESEYPILKEERRVISFYNSLSEESKRYFKISDYFQSIKFAYKFFNFWEEYTGNMLNDSILRKKFENENIFDQENQLQTYQFLKKIKNDYKLYINKMEFSDKIFQLEDVNIKKINSNLIFIDVNNFTKLQKHLIEKYTAKKFSVSIYFWGNERIFDKENLKIKSFQYKDLEDFSQKAIAIHIGDNENNSFNNFLENQEETQTEQLIDFNFEQSSYYHLLNTEYFDLGNSISFRTSPIFLFFSTLNSLLHNLIYEEDEKMYLIPIYSLINAIKEKRFAKYFLEEDSDEILISQTISFLSNLWDNDSLRYLDLQNTVLKHYKKKSAICDYIKKITGFIYAILSIKNIKDLCNFIGKNEPIEISKIVTEEEIKQYNYLELFYRILEDFSVIEEILQIRDWNKMFFSTKFKNKNIAISQGIIRLFLEYMKPKKSQIEYEKQDKKIKLTEFDKTDFTINKRIAILNLIESKIPSKKQNRFFWTESQRNFLELRTKDDISLDDKYKLYRLISLAKTTDLYTYNDAEENIEISSFVEELMLDVKNIKIIKSGKNYSYKNLIQTNLKSKGKIKINSDYKKDKKFYAFGFDKKYIEQPFSYYSLSMLLKNPFMFFLDNLKIKDIQVSDELYFSNKFLGILIHSVLNNNWQRIIEVHKSTQFSHNFIEFENKDNIVKSLKSYINNDQLYYFQTPHNFSSKYFDLIIKPLIIENSTYFFKKFAEVYDFNNKKIIVFAEKNETRGNSSEKIIFPKNEKLVTDIKVKVRADLQVESQNSKVIIDYKTGSGSEEQLLIYERYYYDNLENLKSAIFSFFKKKFDNKISEENREKKFEKLKTKVEEVISKIQSEGFAIPNKKYDSFDNKDLSRTDLYIKYGRQSWLNLQK